MLAAIRIRGSAKVRSEHARTMELLRLYKVNHLVLVEEKQKPMLEKVNSFVTFGEINANVLSKLIEKRARLEGDKKVTEAFLKGKKIKSFEELAKHVIEGKASLKAVGIKPVFRLNCPKKGHTRLGIKKPFNIGGSAGYRANKINELIERMM